MLKNLKVSHAIALVGFLPLMLVLFLAFSLGSALLSSINDSQKANDIVRLTEKLDGIAHNFAVERGLSAGFLGSKGEQGHEAVLKQRVVADQMEQALLDMKPSDFHELSEAEFKDLVQPTLDILKDKNTIRQKVDNLASDNGAFAYYSKLNATALRGIQRSIILVNNTEIDQALSSRLALLWMKERIGQYRGALNGVFGAGQTTEKRFVEINGYLSDEKAWENYFNDMTSVVYKTEMAALKQSADWKTVDQVLTKFQSVTDLSNVVGPKDWFALATAKISLVKGLSDEIGQNVHSFALAKESRDNTVFIVIIAIIVVVVLFVLYLMQQVMTSVSSRVAIVHKALMSVGEEKDFTVNLDVKSNDELGQIMNELNRHLNHLSSTFGMLVSKSKESKSSMDDLIRSSSNLRLRRPKNSKHVPIKLLLP